MPGYEILGDEELNQLKKLFNEGSYLMRHSGPQDKFSPCKLAEDFFANYIGSESSLLTSSGTSAIRLALEAVGIKKGHYIITQPFTFIATFESILEIGCIPVAIPLDKTLGMSPILLREFLTKNHRQTAAIMPVHMLGEGVDIAAIKKISEEFKIPIIEDNCEALGGSVNGKMLGNWGRIGTYSFDFGKIFTSGEGGLITGNQSDINNAFQFHDHSHTKNTTDRAKELPSIKAFNFRYSELQASVLLAQINKLQTILNKNKIRYVNLEKILRKYKRPLIKGCIPSYDTFMISTGKKTEKVLNILETYGLKTKNVPIAMNWHSSFFWNHLDFIDYNKASRSSYDTLSEYVAIGILLTKSEDFYKNLALDILSALE